MRPGARPPCGWLVPGLAHACGAVESFPHLRHRGHGMLPAALGSADQLPPHRANIVTVAGWVLQVVTGNGEMMNGAERLTIGELEGKELIERLTTGTPPARDGATLGAGTFSVDPCIGHCAAGCEAVQNVRSSALGP